MTKAERVAARAADLERLSDWYETLWNRRETDDDALFEVMCLQVFQAGLTWRMVLARRDAFRSAFHGWRVERVAEMDAAGVDRVIQDASIIRNRQKIEACVANARVIQELRQEHGSFCRWFYEVLEGDDLPGLQAGLRKPFRFMGPEIARMWLMASGRIPSDD